MIYITLTELLDNMQTILESVLIQKLPVNVLIVDDQSLEIPVQDQDDPPLEYLELDVFELEAELPLGAVLDFGADRIVRLTDYARAGAETLKIEPVEFVFLAGDQATYTETRKHSVLQEFPESFDESENVEPIRSELDPYFEEINGEQVEIGRVNTWIIEEFDFTQKPLPRKDNTGKALQSNIGGMRAITRTFRIFYYYQFGGGGIRHVRQLTEAARLRFNESPYFDFAPPKAQFFDGVHDGLQLVLATEGDFNGTICYVRAFQVTARFTEPQTINS